ncbi:Uncharacterised protein [uncultured archaeon]|nr:Uncharacterised protein [uncultured archaeon]
MTNHSNKNERKPSVPRRIVVHLGEEYVVTSEHVEGNMSFRSLEPLHERPLKRRRPAHD